MHTDRRASGWTYAVQAVPDGPVKIGRTKKIEQRLASLRAGSPCELELVYLFSGEEQEEYLHDMLAPMRLHNEWFTAETTLDVLALHTEGLEARLRAMALS